MVNTQSSNSYISVDVSSNNNVNRVNTSTNNNSASVESTNSQAKYWAEVSKGYAEQAQNYAEQTYQDVDEIIDNLTGTQNIVITKNGRNVTIGNKHYEHSQAIASDTWVINHNLNKRCPTVVLIDSAGTIYYPPVTYTDENNCTINLIGAMTGTAYLE